MNGGTDSILADIVAQLAGLLGAYVGKKIPVVIEAAGKAIGAILHLLSTHGVEITQADLDRWKADAQARAAALGNGTSP